MLGFNTMSKPKVVLNESLRAGSGKWINDTFNFQAYF